VILDAELHSFIEKRTTIENSSDLSFLIDPKLNVLEIYFTDINKRDSLKVELWFYDKTMLSDIDTNYFGITEIGDYSALLYGDIVSELMEFTGKKSRDYSKFELENKIMCEYDPIGAEFYFVYW